MRKARGPSRVLYDFSVLLVAHLQSCVLPSQMPPLLLLSLLLLVLEQ